SPAGIHPEAGRFPHARQNAGRTDDDVLSAGTDQSGSARLFAGSDDQAGPAHAELTPRGGTSAADLKFLHRVPRVRLRNFKSKSGTRVIELLVPFGFRSSCPSVPRCITNFENRALVPPI